MTTINQARNNDTWGGPNNDTNWFDHSRDISSFSRQTNKWKNQAQPNCNHWAHNARPGAKVTKWTWLSKEKHDWRAAADLCFNCRKPEHKSSLYWTYLAPRLPLPGRWHWWGRCSWQRLISCIPNIENTACYLWSAIVGWSRKWYLDRIPTPSP